MIFLQFSLRVDISGSFCFCQGGIEGNHFSTSLWFLRFLLHLDL